jgi:hypothetical protein
MLSIPRAGPQASASESSRIRSRYLHRLGLTKPKVATMVPPANIYSRKQHTIEVLKNDRGKCDDSINVNSPPLHRASSPVHAKPTVSFLSSVVVHTIPNRKEYSKRVKKTIWMQPNELEESAIRNGIEFAAEGRDWRLATEEQDFICYQNELVHPVHVTRQCTVQRQFLMIMSAQQQQNRTRGYRRPHRIS